MCGRYTVTHSTEEILERFQAAAAELNLDLNPNYNVAPSHTVPIVIEREAEAGGAVSDASAASSSDSSLHSSHSSSGSSHLSSGSSHSSSDMPSGSPARVLQLCQWGLIPFWVSADKKGKPLINARSETLSQKNVFKSAFKKRRCIIPAESFYEWKRDVKVKIPIRIRLKGERLMGFAGIYQDFKTADGEKIRTCAIITVPANEIMAPIHDRMPAILLPEHEKIWLDRSIEDLEALSKCLSPYPLDDLETYVVSTAVNSTRINGPQCIAESDPPSQDEPAKPAKSRSPKAKSAKSSDDQLKLSL